jgi:hypothetical protein
MKEKEQTQIINDCKIRSHIFAKDIYPQLDYLIVKLKKRRKEGCSMNNPYQTDLFLRILGELQKVRIIDCHEHLQREQELPVNEAVHIGRFFLHYANSDLLSAGMPVADMIKVRNDPLLSPKERWALLEPWYQKSWNTGYHEALRIAIRDLYDIEDFSAATVDALTQAMRSKIRPGFTRQIFDRAKIDYAMNNPFGPKLIFNPDFSFDCFICDLVDNFTYLPVQELSRVTNHHIYDLADYLEVIDDYFDKYGHSAGAFKISRAYNRPLLFEDVPKSDVEGIFNRLLAFNDYPDRRQIKALEDFILHYLCRKCGEYGLRMKFHTGLQEENGNIITNSRAGLMSNLFLKYSQTKFDIFHLSYPYQEELLTIAKNFPNVTVDFCWNWIINPHATRRALSDFLDAVPVNKIHGFGGDYIFVEGSYGHVIIARREIARVLCEKITERRFSETYAVKIGQMLLRDNALDNFDLPKRRAEFKKIAGEC